uniref:Acp8 n=1 Tax=Drosophila arizonae TaxID=7263 RepID=Q2VKM7_DROAR|nr:Acp8 [Drosophila arizonae]AAZ42628.1 Acp8 [Drosophila arizonae]AAZ42629.1 Acp8 [Drosophila arizonae]
MNFKYCLLLLSVLLAGASTRPTSEPLTESPCYSPPWCGNVPPPPGAINK